MISYWYAVVIGPLADLVFFLVFYFKRAFIIEAVKIILVDNGFSRLANKS
jgi:hypothetical protein